MGHGGLACNRCAKEIDDGSQVLTTGCMHCFCLGTLQIPTGCFTYMAARSVVRASAECANSICKGDNACSVCGEKLNADNVSVEICRNSDSDVFSLRGAGPADVIMVGVPLPLCSTACSIMPSALFVCRSFQTHWFSTKLKGTYLLKHMLKPTKTSTKTCWTAASPNLPRHVLRGMRVIAKACSTPQLPIPLYAEVLDVVVLQMHVAYKNLVAKVKTFANEKSDKADLLEELRSKAQQHSR